jgi:glycosyltransferase involved in cell wall biosynthesis
MAKRKKRVLVLGPLPPPTHGVATFTRDLLSADADEFELTHLDTSDRRDASNLGRWDPRNIELGFSNLSELASVALRRRPDIVYIPISQNVPAFLRDALFGLQARAFGSKLVLHLHGGYWRELYEKDGGPFFRQIARTVLDQASAGIVLGENLRGIFESLMRDRSIHVVENGVPDPGAWPLRPTEPRRAPVITYLGSLSEEKGVLDLFRAVRLLQKTHPEVELQIGGEFSDAAAREKFLAALKQDNIFVRNEFKGLISTESKPAFFAAGDIFCMPTRYRYEGQPLVILEALSAGLPVVSTQHAAVPSTIEDGKTGVLLPVNPSPEQIAAALRELVENEPRRLAMSYNAREAYLRKYTKEKCHARLFDVFRRVASEN